MDAGRIGGFVDRKHRSRFYWAVRDHAALPVAALNRDVTIEVGHKLHGHAGRLADDRSGRDTGHVLIDFIGVANTDGYWAETSQ